MAAAKTPALVIVDSRNIFHQTESATGFRMLPTVEGIIDAMGDYGFEVLEVHIGVAMPRSQDARRLSNAAEENGAYIAAIESAEAGRVLPGELHRKDRGNGKFGVEEKQIDVACAVDICRHASLMAQHRSPFKAIVVLSQDTDLTPSFHYAGEVGAPLIVAAHERVERRGFPYLLLTERAFRKMARVRPLSGHALRLALAQAVMEPDRVEPWRLIAWDPRRERQLVERSDGLRGVLRSDHVPPTAKPGEEVPLRIIGVDFGRRRNDFPLATCSAKGLPPGKDYRSDFQTRFVKARRGITEVVLDSAVSSKTRLDYPPGGVSSGSRILVDCTDPHRPLVVGPLQEHPSRALMQAEPLCVYPLEPVSPTSTIARTEGGGRVLLSHSQGAVPEAGRRHAAVLVESGRKSGVAKLVSSPLP